MVVVAHAVEVLAVEVPAAVVVVVAAEEEAVVVVTAIALAPDLAPLVATEDPLPTPQCVAPSHDLGHAPETVSNRITSISCSPDYRNSFLCLWLEHLIQRQY